LSKYPSRLEKEPGKIGDKKKKKKKEEEEKTALERRASLVRSSTSIAAGF